MAEITDAAPRRASRSSMVEGSPLERWLIRVRAYFRKEVNELRRQPMLILSLIGGPLLVLVLFGASFVNSNPVLRTVIVMPEGGIPGFSEQDIRQLVGLNFTIEEFTSDPERADMLLRAGDVDVVQVLPQDVAGSAARGERPQILVRSNAINPMVEGWVQYLGYVEVNEINKAILRQQAATAQQEATTIRVKVVDTRGQLGELEGTLTGARRAEIQRNVAELRPLLAGLEARLPSDGALADGTGLGELRAGIGRANNGLAAVEAALSEDAVQARLDQVKSAAAELERVEGLLETFTNTEPDLIVSPLEQRYENIRGGAYQAVIYYAPGVLALLIQHTAITLGALALVRERMMGAFEVFRVAPVNMIQLLLGKYLGYTIFIALAAALLFGGLRLLGVPLLGSLWEFAALVLLLILASLGVGFLISAVSKTDSQAIQLAMISLLLSIFFSGFFIALESFARPALAVSFTLPMTHGVAGFQALMLRGISPEWWVWVGLALIATVTFGLVVFLTGRQLRQA
jgi:ABC-2 type transport system permease protein